MRARWLVLPLLTACSGPTWDFAFDVGASTALSGVSGTGPGDVYLVGGGEAEGGGTSGVIWHFDGDTWTEDPSLPDVPLLVWAHAFADDDVWVVGEEGTVLRGSFGAWEQVESGTEEPLWGVWGETSSDLWIVGGEPGSGGEPTVLRGTNGTLAPVTLDQTGFERPATALLKVWGIDGRTFSVGTGGLIVEWDGTDWVEMPTGPLANDDFVSLWGTSASHIVAVGGRSSARIATFDGTAWTTIAPTGIAGLNAVTMGPDGTAIIGGENGWVGTFDPEVGEPVAEDFIELSTGVHALWFDGDATTYGAAARFASPYTGAAIQRQ